MSNRIDTNTPLDGELSITDGVRRDDKTAIGRVTSRYIYNRKGQKLAKFQRIERIKLENGRTVRARIYSGDGGTFEVAGNCVYCGGVLIGKIKFFQKVSNLIISLILLLLFFLSIAGLIIQFKPEHFSTVFNLYQPSNIWKIKKMQKHLLLYY